MVLYLLFESSSGYGLFEYVQGEEVNSKDPEVQKRILDMATFKQMVHFVAFAPFRSAKDALENMNAASEGLLHEYLRDFLEQNLPSKKKKLKLGVGEDGLASKIKEELSVACTGGSKINELLRGIRLHFDKYIKELGDGFLEQAQLGLAHAYSRGKIKYNVNRADLHIIQSICLLDQLDKDINTFAMRVREWYSWHFPELIKIVSENLMFCRLVSLLKNKSTITDDKLSEIEEIVGDEDVAQKVIDAAKSSMGTDISDFDLDNVCHFAKRVHELGTFRTNLQQYLSSKMNSVAPNLTTLIGESVGARLISQAGSLTNLAKYPASTLQILGAEKALFRALKTRGKTPKYGLIFHSHFIGKAQNKNKGRISRYLANKCSIASRIDCFSDNPTDVYGTKLKEQVEERLEFYNNATTPRKNIDVMKEAKELHELQAGKSEDADDVSMSETTPKKKKKKKKKSDAGTAEETSPKKKKKKKKKDTSTSEETTPKKKKKKKRKRDADESEQPKKRRKAKE